MYWNKKDIQSLDKVSRLNLINSITGIKPANLIGTRSQAGQSNLAIFSSIVHLGSNPALIGLVTRPIGEVPRHTYKNIKETSFYTINHVRESFIEQAHYTSAKFGEKQSEFEFCQLTEEYIEGFEAPFVKESRIKMGMKLLSEIPIPLNGTLLLIGAIQHLIVTDEAIEPNNHLNLENAETVGISGVNSYYQVKKMNQFPYARVAELPNFKSSNK